jgi:hypothetical protein
MEVMRVGDMNRAKAATNMNEHSSRSHSMFSLSVEQHNLKDGSKKSGKLYLVDLAGNAHAIRLCDSCDLVSALIALQVARKSAKRERKVKRSMKQR